MAAIHGPLGTMLVMLIVAPAPGRAADTLDVVATTADLAAVARTVGGDAVDVTALARPIEDTHFVDAKPSFIRLVNRADVLIEGGGWCASTNVTCFPTESSKLRLPYNRDELASSIDANSLWLQLEFLLGAHAAHKF